MTSERDELCPGSSGKSRKMKQGTIIFLRKVKIIFLGFYQNKALSIQSNLAFSPQTSTIFSASLNSKGRIFSTFYSFLTAESGRDIKGLSVLRIKSFYKLKRYFFEVLY